MSDPIQIKEVIKPADQGLSRPYLCRCMDGGLYYVKGKNTTPDSMYKEWICAHLARGLELPIPDFAIVEVASELVEVLPEDFADIGAGLAFGSKAIERPVWFEKASIDGVPAELQRRIFAFDWWVQNCDRSCFNPNLLLDQGSLIVIDHNNAFDPEFDAMQFLNQHVFSDEAKNLLSDCMQPEALQKRFQALLPVFDDALASAPAEWKWYDAEATVPGNFDPEYCKEVISKCLERDFWNIS